MFDRFFGWRKASLCKKLIKRVQCRLKLLKNKRLVVAIQLREDIVHLMRTGYEQIAFKRIDDLYMDENVISVYELLEQFSEFIMLNLFYIRRHKDLPNDINEAVSTLIFASARCGDLPELMLVRKLFMERYGKRFTISALELYPGNLVNQQVKEKLIPHSVTEDIKNRLLNEIARDLSCKPVPLGLQYKPDFQMQTKKVTEFCEDEGKDICINKNCSTSSSTSYTIMLQSTPFAMETPEQETVQNYALMSTPCEYETGVVAVRKGESEKSDCSSEYSTRNTKGSGKSDCSSEYLTHNYEESEKSDCYSSGYSTHSSEDSVIYLDDVQEFKSPTKQGMNVEDQDQRFFVFSFWSSDDTILGMKRIRRKLVSRKKQKIDGVQHKIDYGYEPSIRKKCQKKVHFEDEQGIILLGHESKQLETGHGACKCSLHEPCYFCTNDSNKANEIILFRDYMDSHVRPKCEALTPYVMAATTPEGQVTEVKSTEIVQLNALPVDNFPKVHNGGRITASPRHVHPKLPDYDEIAAKFTELKKVHQLNNWTRS